MIATVSEVLSFLGLLAGLWAFGAVFMAIFGSERSCVDRTPERYVPTPPTDPDAGGSPEYRAIARNRRTGATPWG